jgi:hypothetical protein
VFTQLETEMSARYIPGGKALQERKADRHRIIEARLRLATADPDIRSLC